MAFFHDSACFEIRPRVRRMLADTFTPVGLYLRIRERFPQSFLLESSDYSGRENSFSYLCFGPIASFAARGCEISAALPDGQNISSTVGELHEVQTALAEFFSYFRSDPPQADSTAVNGFFGYLGYDSVQYFEDITFASPRSDNIPDLRYVLFRFIVGMNHFQNEMYVLENERTGQPNVEIDDIFRGGEILPTAFRRVGGERSNRTPEEFCSLVEKVQTHIMRGDVFQIVPSRHFAQAYEGDDLLVYRALRSLNPSPYLFYFDCGEFRIFGSSPEVQLVTREGRATISPIAGTYARSGDVARDAALAEALLQDPKESAEHVMLVDLARNDLSIHCYPVAVEEFRSIQLYSHVIHLVSKVIGEYPAGVTPLQVLGSTFPAGTLTGAPKYRAMELIDRYEQRRRAWYGGCIGFFGFGGESTHAILIRSFLSANGTLSYQAGAGVVADSQPIAEVAEVDNKLRALRAAMERAEELM